MPAVDVGSGTTITFGGGFTAEVVSIDGPGLKRVSLQTTHLGTTPQWHTFMPGNFIDAGELSMVLHLDPEHMDDVPIDHAPEAIVITYPDTSTATGTGFLTEASWGVAVDEIMELKCTLKLTGVLTFVGP